MVKDLILLLRTELDAYKSSDSRQNLTILRQGLFVLRALAVAADVSNSRSFESLYAGVRDEFLLLMSGVVRIFQQRDLCIPEHEGMFCLCRSRLPCILLTVLVSSLLSVSYFSAVYFHYSVVATVISVFPWVSMNSCLTGY